MVKCLMQGHKEDKRQDLDMNLGLSKFMSVSPGQEGSDNTWSVLLLGLTRQARRGS